MNDLSTLTVADLADGICLRAGRIAAAQAELMRWIAEFDRREGWAGPGMLSCAHWLSWRIGLSLGTAREQVRVARRLEDLPEIAAAFGDGRLSYSKVRALTRVAEPGDGIDWVAMARHSSASQLERLLRGVNRGRAHAEAERNPEAAAWQLRTRTRYDENGNFTLTIHGPAELLPVVRAGLDAKKAELQRERDAAAQDEQRAAAEDEGRPDGAQEHGPAGVAREFVPAGPAASAEPAAPAPSDASAEAPAACSSAGPDAELELEPDLDEQAPGWPIGTTVRQLRAAMDAFSTLQATLGAEQAALSDDAPSSRPQPSVPRMMPALRQPDETSAAANAVSEPAKVSDADALLALAQDALEAEQRTRPDVARRRRPQLTAQIDPLTGWARQADGELLPPTSLQKVLKTLPGRGGVLRLRRLTTADLSRQDLGHTAREANTALRELLGAIDGERCRFPGCTRHHKLHAHHVVYWSEGGPTDLANLVLVCSRHHTLLHQHGFQLTLHADRRLDICTADGIPVLHHPAQPWGDPAELAAGCGQLVSAETLPPDHTDARLDLRYAVSILLAQAA